MEHAAHSGLFCFIPSIATTHHPVHIDGSGQSVCSVNDSSITSGPAFSDWSRIVHEWTLSAWSMPARLNRYIPRLLVGIFSYDQPSCGWGGVLVQIVRVLGLMEALGAC